MAQPGWTGDWFTTRRPTLPQPASGNRSAKPWTSAANITSNRPTPRAAGTAASSTGATFSPRCASEEVARASAEMAEGKALPFRVAKDGDNVSGKFTGTVQLTSGKFAIVEKSHEFTLVPWRPIIDRQLGREVAGIVQGGSVSWQLGRQRGLGL